MCEPVPYFIWYCDQTASIRTLNLVDAEMHLTDWITTGFMFHAVATHPGLKMAHVELAQLISV